MDYSQYLTYISSRTVLVPKDQESFLPVVKFESKQRYISSGLEIPECKDLVEIYTQFASIFNVQDLSGFRTVDYVSPNSITCDTYLEEEVIRYEEPCLTELYSEGVNLCSLGREIFQTHVTQSKPNWIILSEYIHNPNIELQVLVDFLFDIDEQHPIRVLSNLYKEEGAETCLSDFLECVRVCTNVLGYFPDMLGVNNIVLRSLGGNKQILVNNSL
jgi:hypothetical protein